MTEQEVDRRCAIGGTLAGVVVAALIALAFAVVAGAQSGYDGCYAVIEQRDEGWGHDWGELRDLCVPENGVAATNSGSHGRHYRNARGGPVCLWTPASAVDDRGGPHGTQQIQQGGRDLSVAPPPLDRPLDSTVDRRRGRYYAYILPNWDVRIVRGGCTLNNINGCDPGICGEWHPD